MIDKILATGLAGVQQGLERAAQSAEEISTAFQPNGSGDIVGPLIELKLSELQVEASAKVIQAGDEMSKKLLEIA